MEKNEMDAINEIFGESEEEVIVDTAEDGENEAESEETEESTEDTTEEETETEESEDESEESTESNEESTDENEESESEEETEESDESEEEKEEEPAKADETFFDEDIKDFMPEGEFKDVKEKQEAVKGELQKLRDVRESFDNLAKNNPEMVVMLNVLGEGKSLAEALNESGILDLIPGEDEPDYDEFQKMVKKNQTAIKERGELSNQFKDNLSTSVNTVKSYIKDNVDEGLESKLKDVLNKSLQDYENGVVGKDFVKVIHDGLTFESKLEALEQKYKKEMKAQEVKIKNEKITKAKKKAKNDPNLPDVKGKSGEAPDKDTFADDYFKDIHSLRK